MTTPAPDNADEQALLEKLRTLEVRPRSSMVDHVVSSWVRVDEGPMPVYVAFSPRGVSFLRTATAVADEPARFAADYHERFGRPLQPASETPDRLVRALREGDSRRLTFDLVGLTDFERAVLDGATTIPRGELRPYQWLARYVGRAAAVRAVGSALGHNPVPVLIPCHRVIRSDGGLGGYTSGLDNKVMLLEAEGIDLGEAEELARRHVRFVASVATSVFCWPTCRHARRIAARNRLELRSVNEATDRGLRPCAHCAPT